MTPRQSYGRIATAPRSARDKGTPGESRGRKANEATVPSTYARDHAGRVAEPQPHGVRRFTLSLHVLLTERFLCFAVVAAAVVTIWALAVPVLITWLNRQAEIRLVELGNGRETHIRIAIRRISDERQVISNPAATALLRSLGRVARKETSGPVDSAGAG